MPPPLYILSRFIIGEINSGQISEGARYHRLVASLLAMLLLLLLLLRLLLLTAATEAAAATAVIKAATAAIKAATAAINAAAGTAAIETANVCPSLI